MSDLSFQHFDCWNDKNSICRKNESLSLSLSLSYSSFMSVAWSQCLIRVVQINLFVCSPHSRSQILGNKLFVLYFLNLHLIVFNFHPQNDTDRILPHISDSTPSPCCTITPMDKHGHIHLCTEYSWHYWFWRSKKDEKRCAVYRYIEIHWDSDSVSETGNESQWRLQGNRKRRIRRKS